MATRHSSTASPKPNKVTPPVTRTGFSRVKCASPPSLGSPRVWSAATRRIGKDGLGSPMRTAAPLASADRLPLTVGVAVAPATGATAAGVSG